VFRSRKGRRAPSKKIKRLFSWSKDKEKRRNHFLEINPRKSLLHQAFSCIIEKVLEQKRSREWPSLGFQHAGDDVEGCDTPGRFATGRGGNFHGASLIFKFDEGGNNNGKAKDSYSLKGLRTPHSWMSQLTRLSKRAKRTGATSIRSDSVAY
jgi:hypothetical protein